MRKTRLQVPTRDTGACSSLNVVLSTRSTITANAAERLTPLLAHRAVRTLFSAVLTTLIVPASAEQLRLWTVQAVDTGQEIVCDAFAEGAVGDFSYELRFRRSRSRLLLVVSYDGSKIQSIDGYATILVGKDSNRLPAVDSQFGTSNAFIISIDPSSFDLGIFDRTEAIQIRIGRSVFISTVLASDHVRQNLSDCIYEVHLDQAK